MAIYWVTGFEHGALSTSGGGLCDAIGGSAIVQNTIKRTGTYALRVGDGTESIRKDPPASQEYVVGRLYFYLSAFPAADRHLVCLKTAASEWFLITIDESAETIDAKVDGGSTVNGPSISIETWYRLDFRAYCGTTTGTLDWAIDGAAQSQASDTTTASTWSNVYLGDPFGSISSYYYYDDVIMSTTTGDYPFGAGQVTGISPTGDGTHNNTNSYLKEDGGNTIDGSSYYAYSVLDALPMTDTAEYVYQTDVDTDDYVEVTFADPSSVGTVNGVMGVLSYTSATTTANDGACKTIDSESTLTTIYDGDMSESSLFYKSAIITEPGGGWSSSEVNALKARVGYSSDATPDPYWQGLILEVDYVPSTGYTLACDAGVYAITGATLAPKHDKKIATTAGSYAVTGATLAPTHDKKVAVDAGTYAITGAAMAPTHDKKIAAAAGSYAITGAAMSPLHDKKLACVAGTYAITGIAATLTYSGGVAAVYGDGWHMFQMMSQN